MKKRLAMLLICAVTVSSLMACGKPVADSTNTDNNVVEAEKEAAEKESVSATAPEISFTSVTADDYDYFTGHVQCLQITDDDHPELKDAVEKYFSGLVKNFNSGIEEMNDQAKQENEDFGDAEYQVKYSDDITVEIMRRDNKLLSLVINDYTFMGGAHGGGSYTGVNFDVATGKQITLDDLGDADTIRQVSKDFILDTIATSSEAARGNLYSDDIVNYKEAIEELFANGNQPEFYLDTVGITFIFQQYDIAPYAAGTISFTVPYSQYAEINDRYTPLEDAPYVLKLSETGLNSRVDFNGDGKLESVSLINTWDEETDRNFVTLTVGAEEQKEESGNGSWYTGYFIHNDEGNFVLVANDGISVDLYEVSHGITKKGHMDTTLSIKEVTDSGFTMGEKTYGDNEIVWSNEQQYGFDFK
ncbi:protein of unknown function [Pseudobutyrivibrio sp. ACV-2]|uniref:DUF3298 and DUF4163 domain-containing protein n=1 Tax=Pseudobutyrivibrio sp. ACV-2 TaxID=1520801 RepID=UPI000895EB26|nr:DUF3298 and DUF4163 domain-containing protein [Pseudobutyrivibrio sp. ACV-2]SEA99960.1 protein of unknown function [Pseudobutyrivibrio sp. ACV-2]